MEAAHPSELGSSLAQTVAVETPELVVFSYTIAGLGSRAGAALIDYALCLVSLFALVLLATIAGVAFGGTRRLGLSSPTGPADVWALAILLLAQFAVLWGYYVLFEGLADGQTPGKRWLRIRVVRDGGYSVGFSASAVRNLVRLVDMQPLFTYGVGMASVALHRTGKRLGDIAAGTMVVREGMTTLPAPTAGASTSARSGAEVPVLQASLSDAEYAVLDQYVRRRMQLESGRRAELAAELAKRFLGDASGLGTGAGGSARSDAAGLIELYERESRARAQGLAGRAQTGAARERHAIAAAGSARWSTFATRLADAQRRGLSGLGEAGVRDFVEQYRAVSADLARLQTAVKGESEQSEVFYLTRLVAGAHNLLYRGAALGLADVVRLFTVTAPREVRRSAGAIALAAAFLFVPAVIAFTSVVRDPAVARVFIPPRMLDRAEEGVRRARDGEGYIPDPQLFRPVMASSIIANNVQVTFGVFAFGMTAGLGTALLLLFNGVSLGGVLGLYASKGILMLLIAFVAPHGVLELSAICIAGGGGFLLAAALILPGRRTRATALVEQGRRAIRLIAASCLLLVFAGALEGFVSPIPWWPLELKLAVSGVTAVALWLYLRAGRTPALATMVAAEPDRTELLGLGASAGSPTSGARAIRAPLSP